MSVAGLGLGEVRAHPFTLVGVADDLAHTSGGTNAAGFGAFTPEAPVGDFAVQSARRLVARVFLLNGGALPAAEGRLLDNLAAAVSVTATALASARSPRRPLTYNAVDRASVHVAGLGDLEVAAGDATEGSFAEHGTAVDHVTATAGLRAGAERGPLGVSAVDRALVAIAGLGLGESRAPLALAGWLLDDSAKLLPVALATSLVAFTPGAPFGDGTVVRAVGRCI